MHLNRIIIILAKQPSTIAIFRGNKHFKQSLSKNKLYKNGIYKTIYLPIKIVKSKMMCFILKNYIILYIYIF